MLSKFRVLAAIGLLGLPCTALMVRAQETDERIAEVRSVLKEYGLDLAENQAGRVTIAGLEPDTPAAVAGLRLRDIILRVDDHKVLNIDDVADYLQTRQPGQKVEIRVDRAGRIVAVALTGLKRQIIDSDDPPVAQDPALLRRTPLPLRAAPLAVAPRRPGEPAAVDVLPGAVPVGPRHVARRPATAVVEVEPAPAPGRPAIIEGSAPPAIREGGLLGMFLVEDDRGRVVVTGVSPDTPAAAAGIRKGDSITKINGEVQANYRDMLSFAARLLDHRKPGDDLPVTIERDGKEQNVHIVLSERGHPLGSPVSRPVVAVPATTLDSAPVVVAVVHPFMNQDLHGFMMCRASPHGAALSVRLYGLKAGASYRLVIHEFGDAGDLEHDSSGTVLNLADAGVVATGSPAPLGDLGVLEAGQDGTIGVKREIPGVRLDGPAGLIGRTFAVHLANASPTASEPIEGYGVIGYGNPRRLEELTREPAPREPAVREPAPGEPVIREPAPPVRVPATRVPPVREPVPPPVTVPPVREPVPPVREPVPPVREPVPPPVTVPPVTVPPNPR